MTEEDRKYFDEKFSQIGTRLGNVETRLGNVETGLDEVKMGFADIEGQLESVRQCLTEIEKRLPVSI